MLKQENRNNLFLVANNLRSRRGLQPKNTEEKEVTSSSVTSAMSPSEDTLIQIRQYILSVLAQDDFAAEMILQKLSTPTSSDRQQQQRRTRRNGIYDSIKPKYDNMDMKPASIVLHNQYDPPTLRMIAAADSLANSTVFVKSYRRCVQRLQSTAVRQVHTRALSDGVMTRIRAALCGSSSSTDQRNDTTASSEEYTAIYDYGIRLQTPYDEDFAFVDGCKYRCTLRHGIESILYNDVHSTIDTQQLATNSVLNTWLRTGRWNWFDLDAFSGTPLFWIVVTLYLTRSMVNYLSTLSPMFLVLSAETGTNMLVLHRDALHASHQVCIFGTTDEFEAIYRELCSLEGRGLMECIEKHFNCVIFHPDEKHYCTVRICTSDDAAIRKSRLMESTASRIDNREPVYRGAWRQWFHHGRTIAEPPSSGVLVVLPTTDHSIDVTNDDVDVTEIGDDAPAPVRKSSNKRKRTLPSATKCEQPGTHGNHVDDVIAPHHDSATVMDEPDKSNAVNDSSLLPSLKRTKIVDLPVSTVTLSHVARFDDAPHHGHGSALKASNIAPLIPIQQPSTDAPQTVRKGRIVKKKQIHHRRVQVSSGSTSSRRSVDAALSTMHYGEGRVTEYARMRFDYWCLGNGDPAITDVEVTQHLQDDLRKLAMRQPMIDRAHKALRSQIDDVRQDHGNAIQTLQQRCDMLEQQLQQITRTMSYSSVMTIHK